MTAIIIRLLFLLSILSVSCSKEFESTQPEPTWTSSGCDPFNPDVPATGDPALGWITPVSQETRVEHVVFCSGAAQTEVSYHIYKPKEYDSDPSSRFPVLYWLHGGGPGPGISGIPFITNYFDNAIRAGFIPPKIIVFPHSPTRPSQAGNVISMWVDSKDKKSPVETILIKEIIPHVDATFRTVNSKKGRAVDGFSMGGYGAARLGFKFSDMFTSISILGAGPMQATLSGTPRISEQARRALLETIYGGSQDYFALVSPRKHAEQNLSALQDSLYVRIAVGDLDETFKDNKEFHEYLTELKIPHQFIVGEGIPHDPVKLLNFLGDDNWEYYRKVWEALAGKGQKR